LKPGRHPKTGYRNVSLRREGKSYNRYVHRLVLEAFVGPCPKGMQSRHFPDKDTSNNALTNLQWGTPKQNQDDRITHGTDGRGERHWNHHKNKRKKRHSTFRAS
jgi:hypothetical protein